MPRAVLTCDLQHTVSNKPQGTPETATCGNTGKRRGNRQKLPATTLEEVKKKKKKGVRPMSSQIKKVNNKTKIEKKEPSGNSAVEKCNN